MRSLLFVLLATGTFAAPVSKERHWPPKCDTKLNRFHHKKDLTYNYEGETVSSVAGASSARSGLRIRARCVVKAVGPCQHVLKIDQVELWEAQSKNPGPLGYQLSQGTTAFAEELEAQDLVFRTNGGLITDVFAHPEDPSHVLNIKRGILSALQAQFVDEQATVEEEDVVGKCKVHYEVKSRHLSRRPKVVYKTRNLTECTDRAQSDIGIHVHSYEEKPLSLLSSHSTCRLLLTAKKRTQQVVCQEEHIFRPFSAGYKNKSGAITKTRQKLDLQSITPSESEPVVTEELRPVSLKYAHAQPQSNEKAINDAFYLLTRLSKDSRQSTKPDSAQHFSDLVFKIRKLTTPAMESLWQKVHNEEDNKMHEYFYDALPHCGNGGCAKVMSQAIRNKVVSHERGNMFLAGLAMAANPSKETVGHVLELCKEHPGRTAMLTLGTLIHKVCENSPQECNDTDKENPIAKVENFLLSRLNTRCEGKTPEEFENSLITLKAIGNAGRPVAAENVLLKCAANSDVPVNMSIAALEAFRRLPCNEETTDQILQIYGNYNLDVEIRIAAYLALMKCPSPEVFKRVADVLKNEVNNQVGSFVWSHMTNAMDSTEPVHGLPQAEMMKDALNGMKLREFNLNRLRFSRAWEGSFYSDVLRFGGSAQSHLIYHPNSFFPRSAMVNLTVDVLGASINVLEAAARFEGFEILIEQMFGEDGYYPDDRIMKMFNLKPHEERDNEEKTVNYKRLRGRRSIQDDINKVENHLNKLHARMDTRKHHPSGAVSVKMFGNEMRLASFDDISWLNDEVDKINMIDILIALAKGGKKSFSKSMMFLDAQTTVPTILGLPLKLSAKGTTVAAVELAGKFDIRNMFWGKMSFDVRGYVKPSAVVDITGRMGVSALYAEAGILVNSSLYTVTQIKGNATYSQGEILKFEIGVPEEPVQFVNVSSSLFITLNDEKLPIEGTPRRIEPTPCLNMTRVLGITFCGQLSLPLGYRDYESPFFPFSGPASFSLSMQRTDPKLTKYQLIAERLETEDDNKYDVIAKLSTPGAMWERNFEANGTLWLKKDGKLFSVSTGAVGLNFGKFEATYNNITHAVNLTYSAKDVVYGHPIVLNGHFFNNTELSSLTQELGIQLSASYKNYTIKQLTKLYNRSGVYGFVSNMTYWTGKYLYASGEFNIPKKSVSFLANHTCTKTEVSFNGYLGEEEDNFVFSFSNEPTKAGIDLTGRLLKAEKEGVLHLFARPCEQSFTLRGSYAKAEDERGIRFTASHDNKNRVIRWYTGIVNATNEKSLKINATMLGSKAEAVWTYFNLTQSKGVKFNGLFLNKSMDAVWSFVNIGDEKGLRFNGIGFNKTIEASWTLFNLTSGKGLKFNATAINKTIEAFWSYVNVGKEKGLRFDAMALNHTIESALTFRNFSDAKSIKLNATVFNKTLEAVWSYVSAGKEKGLLFNVTAMNKTAALMWSYFNVESKKGLRFNASALNKTIDATWTFIGQSTEKSLVFKAIALNNTIHSTWSVLNLPNEKSLIFNASAGNKSINATWSFLNLENTKSLNFKASAVNKTVNATWSFLNLEKEKSLKFKASTGNKTLNAKWTLLTLENEKSLQFKASVLRKTINATWTFLNLENEKSLKFQASAVNKTMDASWTFLNMKNEKSLKFQASALKKIVNATWTFFNLENEKGLKFQASAVNKTLNATWTLVKSDSRNSLKFEASALNKTLEAKWTLLNLRNEKSLKFRASMLNRTAEATWTIFNFTSEKGLRFKANAVNKSIETTLSLLNSATEKSIKINASALNKTIETMWTFVNFMNEKLIKFNATGFNRSAEAVWSYVKKDNERFIKFNVSAMKRTAEAVLSYVQTRDERAIKFNASVSNKSIEAIWTFLNSQNEKAIKVNAFGMNKTVEAVWSYVRSEDGRAIKFNASAMNKTIEAAWSYARSRNEKAIKFHASAMNKTIEAVWSYERSENEKAIKFHAAAMNKTIVAIWSYERSEDERAFKFNASAMNKTIEAIWSYERNEDERAFKFNASAMNKTLEAMCSYANSNSEKAIKFHASAMNKTIEAVWSYKGGEDERAIKFNASAMNKTIEAIWSYANSNSERAIKFHASAMNKTIEAVWSYKGSEDERAIKFNASAMNKTIEAVWSYARTEDERAIKFYGSVVNKTLKAVWSYSKSDSIKFNASTLNKTVEACWTYLKNGDERAIKFHASAMNKSVEAVWSYMRNENERSFKFNGSALNKTMEAVWTLVNLDGEKGIKFNLAVMNKTMNTSLVYYRNSASTGLHLNMRCCNKSFDLLSKIVFQEKESKVIIGAAYQNSTVALVGLLQNSPSQKIACIYPEYRGQSHGKLCAVFINSLAERSMALNLTVLNRTGELKTQRFTDSKLCGIRVTAKFNKTNFFESWVGLFHTNELKSLHFNATVVNKSVGASLYFRNDTEKAIGFNATVLKKQVGVEGVWLNGKTLKEAAVVLFWNKTVAAKSFVMFLNTAQRKILEYRVHIGSFVAEWQNTLISKETGLKELAMLRMLRNGSQSLFFDSSKLIYSRAEKSHELGYQYIVKTMGRTFEYGWDASYNNFSNAEDSYHEAKVSLIYTKGKKVSLTGIYKNTSQELSNTLTVEYLPEKTMTQALIWYKERKSVDVRVEFIPRRPIIWTTSWNTYDGLSVSSIISFFDKKIENWLQYSKSTGEYEGHFEICPAFPLEVSGVLSKEHGLLFTTEIAAFKRTWNHKIDFKRDEQKLQVSVDVLPNAPVALDLSWDNTEGMGIAMDLKGFKKSLSLVWEYDKLTKSFTSSVTIFKRTLTFTEKLDMDTKTLFLTFSALKRTVGFSGRFDWKNYIMSTFVSYQHHKAGWFLRFNPSSKSIVFNVTVTPRISGQVVGEMPDDYRLQATIQRKLGENVVNESRLMYLLNAEASRLSLTWNTSTITALMNRVKLLKTLIRNATLEYYNLTVLKGENLTKEFQLLIKKVEAKIKPVALKLYAHVKNYNYTGMLQNATVMAQNLTQSIFNVTIQTLNDTINRLPKMMRNATELYKRIRLNVTIAYKRFRAEVLPPIIGNITLHLKNISRDVKVWANNVSIMVSAVTVRGEKLGDIAKRLSKKVEVTTAELVEKIKVKSRQLIIKIREAEIRGQKIGPLYDKYMLEVKQFTCNFNASCTLKNVTIIARNLTLIVRNLTVLNKTLGEHLLSVRSITVLNKTFEEHFKTLNRTFREKFELLNKTAWKNINILRKKACLMHQTALNFTKNLTKVLPQIMRNATIQAIHLARNVTQQIRTIYIRIRRVTLVTYRKLMKTHRPLITFGGNVFISVKEKAYPLVRKAVTPIGKFAADLKSNVTKYLKPFFKPLVPMALDIIYQVRNITIRRVPIGQALDEAVLLSMEIASETLTSLNHTLYSNISAVITFISDHSRKTPDEIVDFAIGKSFEFFNISKKILNQSIELGFNLSRRAPMIYNRSLISLNKTLQKLQKLRPTEIMDISIKKIQVIAKNITAEVLNVTKQLRALDLIGPVKEAWKEMDLKGKFEALELSAKWEKFLERVRALNIKKRALLVKYHIGNVTLKFLKEVQDITNLTQRVLNLTSDLVLMKVSKDAFVKEFLAIGSETRRVFVKYGALAKNISFNCQRKLKNVSYEMAGFYKNITVNKTVEAYNMAKKFVLACYNEHKEEGLKMYNLYKEMSMKIYEDTKEKAFEKFNVYREMLRNRVNALIAKLRQYEDMTYEEIIINAYEFSSKQGLALYKNVTLRAMKLYKNVSVQVVKLYNNITFQAVKFYNNLTLQALKLYKNVSFHVLRLYKNVSFQAIRLYKNVSFQAVRLYKNISFQAVRLYNNVSSHAVALYKNVTLIAVKLFNETKNATLRAYNLTLVLVNRTKLMALQYYNATRNLTLHYYNLTRKCSLQYYNLTRNLTLQHFHKVFNLSRNYTLHVYNVTRNIALGAYNKTSTLVLRGIRYVNVTVVPLVKENYLKGKGLALRYADKTVLVIKQNAQALKVWYDENKEKTMEELYHEAYELAESKYIEIRELVENKYYENREIIEKKIKETIKDAKAKLEVKVEEWKQELKKLNKTVMIITKEAISLYNQTSNITCIAVKDLAAIFHPYVKLIHNQTILYLVKAKNISLPLLEKAINISLPLLEKARNITVLKLNETRKLLNDSYRRFMARNDIQEFIQKHQLDARYAKAGKFVGEKYNEIVEYVEQMKPEVEAKVKEVIFYLNVTLPAQIKQRYASLKKRYDFIEKNIQEIMVNPKEFIETLSKEVLRKIKAAIKDTPIEKVIYHEMWAEFIEEVRQHEVAEAGKGVIKYTSSKLRVVVQVALKKSKLIVEKLRERSELMAVKIKTKVLETRERLLEKLEQFKAMKLREIVEHEYVFKTIDLARNVTLKIRNITLEAKNLTRKFVHIGQIYYKNMTANVKNYTMLLKAKVQNYTTILKAKVQNYTAILKAKAQNYTSLLKAQVQNYTILLKAHVHNYTILLKAKIQNYTNIVKATLQNYTKSLNGTIQNYTKIFNVTVQKYAKILNATVRNYTKVIRVAVKNYTLILGGHYERIYKSHLAPLYRNYTTLVKKYRAMAERYINRYKNVTLKEVIAIARNWTAEKVNLTSVWINRTLERGMSYCRNQLERCMRYYREELKPLYYSKFLPFYKNSIVPMYHNCSKLVKDLKKNITEKALELREKVLVLKEKALELKEKALEHANDLKVRVFDMSSQAVQMTLDSTPYAILRKFGRMTIRESILEGRALCIRAYNLTLNLTRLAMNVTLEKFNNTKLQLIRALNTSLLALNTTLDNSKPVIRFLNATRVEVIKTAVFISKYYGFEDAVKERVRRSFDLTKNMTMAVVNKHGPRLLKELAVKTSEFVNTTMGYVNRTVGYLNVTLIKVTQRFNKTVHNAHLLINRKFLDARDAMNRTIQTVRIAINNTIHTVYIAVNQTIHTVHIAVNQTIHVVQIAVNKTVQTVRIAVNKTVQTVRIAVNRTIQDVRIAVNKTISKARISIRNAGITIRNAHIAVKKTIIDLRAAIPKYIQVTDEGITVVFPHPRPFGGSIKSFALASVERVKTLKQDALEKMESLKQEAVIKMNSLKREAIMKFKSMKQEAVEKVELLKGKALEKMETLKVKALEKMEELKAKALEKMEKLKNEALEMMKSLKQQAVIKMETLKQKAIETFDEVKAKAIEIFDEVKVNAKNMSIRVRTIGKAWVAVAVNKTVFYRQKTYGFVMKFYNLTRNHNLTGKYINTTLHYLNITKNLVVFYRNQTQGFLINAYNLTRNHPLTKKYVNITLHYLNMTKDLAIAYRQKTGRLVRFVRSGYRHIKNHPVVVRYINMTVHCFNVTKNFVEGLNMTHLKNVTYKYLSGALNLSRHCYNATNRYLSRALNMSRHCYNVTNRYLSRALNLSRHYSNVTKRYLSHALNLSRHWYGVCVNKTLNISIEMYKVGKNVTLDIYNSSCLGEAMGKAKNYSKIAINVTMKLYLKALSHGGNVSAIALNKTLRLYRDALLKCRNYTTIALNKTLEIYQRIYNKTMLVVYNTTMMKKHLPIALNLSRQWGSIGFNVTRNFTVQAYKVVANVTLDIYNSTCLGEALGKTKNYSVIAFNKTLKLCRIALNKSFKLGHHLYNKTMLIVKNTTVVKKYLPIARQWCVLSINATRNMTVQAFKIAKRYLPVARQWCVFGFNTTRNFTVQALKGVANVTLDIYNSTCLSEALGKTRNYSMITLNKTLKLCRIALNKSFKLGHHLYNKAMLIVKNTTAVKKYLPIARQWCVLGFNTTRNLTVQAYNMAKMHLPIVRQWCYFGFNTTRNFTVQAFKAVANVTLDIYNSTCLGEALGKTRNYSMIAFNKTFRLCRHLYNKTMFIVKNTSMVRKYLPMARQWCVFGFNVSRNFTVEAYEVAANVSLDIYNSTCLLEALGRTKNYSKIAFNETLKLYRKAIILTRNFTITALNKSFHCYREALAKARNFSMIAFNRTIQLCQRLQNKTLSIVYNSTLVNKCVPMALNFSRQTMRMVYNSTMVKKYLPMALNVSRQTLRKLFNCSVVKKYLPMALNFSRQTVRRIYNCTVVNRYLPIALNISRKTIEMVYNCTTKKYLPMAFNFSRQTISRLYNCNVVKKYIPMALNISRQTIKMVYNCTINKYLPMALNFSRHAVGMVYNCTTKRYFPMALNFSRHAMTMVYNSTVVKEYIPMALNVSRQWCSFGFNATRNFTVQVYEVALNVTLDICNSTSLPQAWSKARNYSRIAFNQTMKICLNLYRGVYNVTLERCAELRNYSIALYKKIREHERTVKYMNHARSYVEHSKNMIHTRVRNLHGAKRYMQKRINHQVSRMSHLLNPINWIPPFNSTAMIFGGPHVYTFDGTYYTFPGYQKSGCMYVLARDVRDNKFTILSQETAIIVVTEDSSVKIHQDGRVETIVKVTSSGKKLSDGYHSELPVETFNTTIQREGSFIVLRHDLGLEIICDVEHFLCTFNIARWFHGRMAGLLGTNNNEFHDEMMTSYNTPTSRLTDFVNSWEVTRDPECKVSTLENEKPKCKESTYIQRCRALFKDKNSPLSHFYSVVDPEPFVKACEHDYKECDTSTPKDMRHCNTTAAYIELVRLQGLWAEYLPECGRCGGKQIGQRWFQKADKAVDVVILVHETSILKSYAEKLPMFLTSLTQSLDPKFSFRFGVMGFGGRLLHEHPHIITLNGQLMNDLASVELAFEHLKFAGENSENDTGDALEAMAAAAYRYPFRPGATKIFLLLTSTDRNPLANFTSLESISNMLESKDIILNVIGKYRKFRKEVIGQNFRGNVFYRKKPEIGSGAAPLPEGGYVSLMKATKGSVFGLPFLGSENKDKFGALQQASASAWREQIKRDQYICKECFCARGDAGQGKTICKKNSLHNRC